MDCAFSHLQVLTHGHPAPLNFPSTSHHSHASMPPLGAGSVVSPMWRSPKFPSSHWALRSHGSHCGWCPPSFRWLSPAIISQASHFASFWYTFLGARIWLFHLCIPITCHSALQKSCFSISSCWMNECINEGMNFSSTILAHAVGKRSSGNRCHAKERWYVQ